MEFIFLYNLLDKNFIKSLNLGFYSPKIESHFWPFSVKYTEKAGFQIMIKFTKKTIFCFVEFIAKIRLEIVCFRLKFLL